MKLSSKQKQNILSIINEPAHECGEYDDFRILGLFHEIEKVCTSFEDDELGLQSDDVIEKINNYVKANVHIRHQYFTFMGTGGFEEEEKYYRTAYAALCNHEAVCSGYAEVVRCLLAAYDIPSYTLITKLPGANKQLLHYVTVVEDNGKYRVLDPEREGSCERKGYDFDRYLDGMTYIIPGEDFAVEKIGDTGVGPKALEYLDREGTISLPGTKNIGELVKIMEEQKNVQLSRNNRK